jgi:hypothetical protein
MNSQSAEPAFEMDGQKISIGQLMPTKNLPPNISISVKYQQTEVSMLQNGIIEPIVVFPKKDDSGEYLLLDGHLRIQILENLGITETFCLISKDDESYTYNKFINRLTTIQEHFMILKGIKSGVSEEKLAERLGIDIGKIKEKANLLKGICPEAVEILKTQEVSRPVFGVLRKMSDARQIEVAQTMVDANKFSLQFVRAMLVLSSDEKLIDPGKAKKKVDGLSPEQLARTEQEMTNLESEYQIAENSLANDVLTMVVFRGYIEKLTNNPAIADYLSREQTEIFQEFQNVVKLHNTEIQ